MRSILFVIAALGACENEPAVTRRSERVANAPEPPPAREAAFDFRRVRFERDEHIGRERACDVHFVEPVAPTPPAEPDEAFHYPEGAAARTSTLCLSDASAAWIDLVLDETARERASTITSGTRIIVKVLAPDGGFSDYPIAWFVRTEGSSDTSFVDREAEPNGFDFGSFLHAGDRLGRAHPCAVDFASQLASVDERERRREDYDESVAYRMDVRCLHAAGDSWVDLVFEAGKAPRSLEVVRGARIELFALTAEDGFADRPIVTLESR